MPTFRLFLCLLGVLLVAPLLAGLQAPDPEPPAEEAGPDWRLKALQAPPARRRAVRQAPAVLKTLSLPLFSSVGGQRHYLIYVPPGLAPLGGWPLVVVFHGGGGHGEAARLEGAWDTLATRERFVVVFAEGTRPQPHLPPRFSGNPQTWNDGSGRQAVQAVARGEDDLGYTAGLLDDVASRWSIDPDRVYATGFSNGAAMTLYLARHLPERFSAVAAVAGMDPLDSVPQLAQSLSVLYMTGTADPLNPVNGGEVFLFGQSIGFKPATADLFTRWLEALDCPAAPVLLDLGDSQLDVRRHGPCRDGTTAELWLIEGHGHHWPGGASPLGEGPQFGPNVARFDASQVIWDFFAQR